MKESYTIEELQRAGVLCVGYMINEKIPFDELSPYDQDKVRKAYTK